MVKTLVAIEVDLASSFAIRFACQLGNLIRMEIHPIYVKFPSAEFPITGVGWVRSSWEREVVEKGRIEIQEMLSAETDSCPLMQEPRVIYGDREIELLHVIEQEPFDLYIEGAPYPFTPATIYKRWHTKFYQRLICPLIWLRSVRKIDQVVAVCLHPEGLKVLVEALKRLFVGSPLPLNLAYAKSGGGGDDMLPMVQKAVTDLKAQGCQAAVGIALTPGEGGPPPELSKTSGLVAVALGRGTRKDSPPLSWLPQISNPLLLVQL
ncbi:MAG TPA: hypothetical protein DCY27_01800 [Desulfobacterales bacterium]|nr:hypothetical protein [Desulfobacterales bacterium]